MAAANLSSSVSRPFSPSGSAGGGEGLLSGSATTGPKFIVPARLPREGPASGGGRLTVTNRDLLDKAVWDCESPGRQSESELPVGLKKKRRPSGVSGSSKRTGHSTVPSNSTSKGSADKTKDGASKDGEDGDGKGASSEADHSHDDSRHHGGPVRGSSRKLTPAERKKAEIKAKWEKLETQRCVVHKDIQERLERNRGMRSERLKRLTNSLACRDNLAATTAVALMELEAHEQQRKRDLYEAWDERVFQPLATQAYEHMNPTNRRLQQAQARSKSVCFDMPCDRRVLRAPVDVCPVRKSVVDLAREASFHTAASQVLGHAQSMPDLRYHGHSVVPFARSRPTLEPQLWSAVKLQGTACGHLAQMAEAGENFRTGRRMGPDVHMHDESDGVEACGKRTSRLHGHGDSGVLRGSLGPRGESASFRHDWTGGSTAAPVQDHYGYESGDRVTDLEFPLGKRTFPHMH